MRDSRGGELLSRQHQHASAHAQAATGPCKGSCHDQRSVDHQAGVLRVIAALHALEDPVLHRLARQHHELGRPGGTGGAGDALRLVHLQRDARPGGPAPRVDGQHKPQEIRVQVPETLELVGLTGKADRLPEELSGGEQQRVAIARAIVNNPKILIADEPTGNLDPATSVGIMKLLGSINRRGTTVIMATHDSTIVDQMRRRVIELEDGNVVRDQTEGVYGAD